MDASLSNSLEAVSSSLDDNLRTLQVIYTKCKDVIFHDFLIGGTTRALIVYFEGMVNLESLDRNVLSPLLAETIEEWNYMEKELSSIISISDVKETSTFSDIIAYLPVGNVGLYRRTALAYSLGLAHWEKRSIEEPSAESVIRGPREGFTETMCVNTVMLRRKIKSPLLKMVSYKIGKHTRTEVVVIYMEGIANEGLVQEVEQRIAEIEIDGILESGYIEGLIEDHPLSPFPQIQVTERPDVVCAALLEGRTAILVDGTPFSLIAPATLFSLCNHQKIIIKDLLLVL